MSVKELQKFSPPAVPEYVIQPNVISQAIYDLGPYARKLVALAMSLMSPDEGIYTASFKVTDFIEAIGLEVRKQGTPTKEYVKAAVRECLDSHIEINHPNGDWEGYTWFTKSMLEDFRFEWDWGWGIIHMTFNPDLGEVIKAFKKAYARINLGDLGKLQSRYAIRFYELALSYAGFAGKDGNRPGEWYFEKTLDDIRMLFQVDKKKYKITKDFRVYVIDKPINEINTAGIGLWIEPQYVRRGKRLIGAKFNCQYIKREKSLIRSAQIFPTTAKKQNISMGDEQGVLLLRQKYPEEWEKYRIESLKEFEGIRCIPGMSPEERAEEMADERIVDKYGKK